MSQLPNLRRAYVYHDPELRAYPTQAPFSPGEVYPEYRLPDAGTTGPNHVYRAVRDCLNLMGLDAAHFGTSDWNPIGEIIQPGQTVLIKPNLVLDFHGYGWSLESVVTHGSVIRAVLDYVLLALEGRGRIIIGDAPLQMADFNRLHELLGLDTIIDFLQDKAGVPISLVDFRTERAFIDGKLAVVRKEKLKGDPNGYQAVDLGGESLFAPVSESYLRYRVTNYDPLAMPAHHNIRTNEYLISGSVLKADAVIFLPKMKTHRKAGITAALKNGIGINGHKDWLPHHRRGSKAKGGDEYVYPSLWKAAADYLVEKEDVEPSLPAKKLLQKCRGVLYRVSRVTGKDRFFEGSWYGNDTLWRTILDLNRILLYADTSGHICPEAQRRCLFLVDGIIAGEGEGPLEPTPKPCGLIVGGFSAPVVDAVVARLMGFDYGKIPSIREAFRIGSFPLVGFGPEEIEVVSNSREWTNCNLAALGPSFGFVPTQGWQGHIELEPPGAGLSRPVASFDYLTMTYRGARLP